MAKRGEWKRYGESGLPEGYQILEYEIVDEPMEDAESRIPEGLGAEAESLHRGVFDDPRSVVGRLEELVRRYPDSPVLGNWLTVAYQGAGMDARADEAIEAQYRKWPAYLFARVNYAHLCMRRRELDRVPEVFGGVYDLKLMYPDRTRFHLSEFIAFVAAVGEYFHLVSQDEVAARYLGMLEEVAPDHPATERMEMMLLPWKVMQALERRRARGRGRRKTGGKKKGKRKE